MDFKTVFKSLLTFFHKNNVRYALMDWIRNETWEGKLSKKQKSKVGKIESILGGA